MFITVLALVQRVSRRYSDAQSLTPFAGEFAVLPKPGELQPPRGTPSLPASFFQWMLGLVRRIPAPFWPPVRSRTMKGRMLRRTPSSMSRLPADRLFLDGLPADEDVERRFAFKNLGKAASAVQAPRRDGPRRRPRPFSPRPFWRAIQSPR